MADDNNVCLKCGESGHPNYECPTKGDDQVKSALINLRRKLQGDDVEDKDMSKEGDDEEEDRFRQENYKATREGEYMYLQSIPLSVIGDRAYGEKSINGVRAVEKGPMTKPTAMLGMELNTHCRPNPMLTEFTWKTGRTTTASISTKPCDTTLDEGTCGRRLMADRRRRSMDLNVTKPVGWTL